MFKTSAFLRKYKYCKGFEFSLKMAMSKVMCASNISKDCFPEPECYVEKSMALVIENLNPKAVMDYVRFKSATTVSVDNIKGIVGGSNMMYHCIELDQAKGIYEICRNHLLLHLISTERPIMFFSECQEMFAKMMVAVTFRKASKGNRAHLMFLSALMIEIHERIPVGFAHRFDLPGEFYQPIISQACTY